MSTPITLTSTPRTDAEVVFPSCNNGSDTSHPQGTHVTADFARELERELAIERARLDWMESSAATELQSERGWIDRAAIDAAIKGEAK